MPAGILSTAAMVAARAARRETAAHASDRPVYVSDVYPDPRHRSRPFAVTVKIGCIVRVERYADAREAVTAREQLAADAAHLAKRLR